MTVDLLPERPAPRSRPDALPESDPFARRLRLQDSRGRLSDTLADIQADVTAALGLGQFRLLYQPRFSLGAREVVAIEGLLRWEDSSRGLLGPKAFLPLVAQTSAMVGLGRWVLDAACQEAVRWERERPTGVAPIVVSINIAAQEVLEADYVDHVHAVLAEHGLPSALLQLELDASDPLRGETIVATRLHGLRQSGVRIAIDGASPLLGAGSARIDADSVHLHRRWVRGVATDAVLAEAVAALVRRVHESAGTVCATGVECRGQADALAALGCDHAQGFLLCDPVPAEALGWLD